MPLERQVPGARVLQWLARTSLAEWDALLGCQVDDGKSEEAWTLAQVMAGTVAVTLADAPDRVETKPWSWLGRGILLVPPGRRDVLDLIESSRPDHEKALDAAKARLHGHGFDPDRFATSEDIALVDRILSEAAERRVVPKPEARSAVYEAVRRCGQDRRAIPVFRTWTEAVERHRHPLADILGRLHLAVMLRHTGAFQESLDISEALNWPSEHLRAGPGEIAALSLNRAATLLDVYEFTGKVSLLDEAERHLKRAYAASQSQEVSATYGRWRSFAEKLRQPPVTLRLNPNSGKLR